MTRQKKKKTFNTPFLIIYLEVYPLLLLQKPSIINQVLMVLYWQNSRYTFSHPITLTFFLLSISPSDCCHIKIQMSFLDFFTDKKTTPSPNTRTLINDRRRAGSCHRNWSHHLEEEAKSSMDKIA